MLRKHKNDTHSATGAQKRTGIPVSVVIPSHNDAAIAQSRLAAVRRVMEAIGRKYEIVIIDDASTDGNDRILKQEVRGNDSMRLHLHKVNQGVAKTMHELYERARHPHIVLFSLDLEWEVGDIPRLLDGLGTYDIVIGNRTRRSYRWHRKLVSYGLAALNKLLFGVDTYDSQSIKAMKREVFHQVPTISQSVFEDAERVIRAVKMGYTMGVVPISHYETDKLKRSVPKISMVLLSLRDMARVWLDLFFLRYKQQ